MKKKNVELVDIMTGFGYKKTNAEAILHTPPSAKGYMRLRDWGIECMHVLMPHNLMIMNSPTGSGKSVVGASIVQQKLENDNNLRAIIAVPETLIGKGFTNEKKIELFLEDGKIKIPFIWHPLYNLCTASVFESKADELIDFVKRPVVDRKGKSLVEDFNERVLVCCHQTLIFAYNKLFGLDVHTKQKKENAKIWNNLLIAVDEAHALQGGADDEEGYLPESPNHLGNLVVKTSEDSKKQNNHVLLITATFFRGDRKALLPESILTQFARFDLPYDVWLNQMKWFKGFTYDFVVGARDVADPNDFFAGYQRSFSSLITSGHKKIIAYIPHRSNRMATGDKYAEVRRLLDIMKETLGCHDEQVDSKTGVISLIGKKPDGTLFAYKVLDLVDEEMRNKKKYYFSDDEINKNADALDCILALDMFKEGCDWEYANGMIITGIKKSLTEVIQMIGRLLRDKEGKPTAKIMHLLPFSPAAMPMDDNLNQFFKCIGLSLLMEHIYNPVRIEIKEKRTGKGGSSGSTPPPPVFDNLDLDENQRNRIITGVQEELVKYAGELQEIKGIYTPKELREKMPEIMEKLLADEGITLSEDDLLQASEEVYFLFPRRTLEMQGVNVDHITWEMLEEADPIEFMLKYVSRECNKEALSNLRRMIARNIEENKMQLLKMAKDGKPKPTGKKNKLATALSRYVHKSQTDYDAEFDNKIRKLAPHWFLNAETIKKKLIEIAKSGAPKPKRGEPFGWSFRHYLRKDSAFAKEIMEINSSWVLSPSDLADRNKEKLLKMAASGEEKPDRKLHPLGKYFDYYTMECTDTYDAEFSAKLKAIAPAWFITRSALVQEKKEQLLEMAKNGEKRPNQKSHPLGASLSSYIKKKSESYDPEFTAKIKKIAPIWLTTKSDRATIKKQQLIELAKSKSKKPNKNSEIGRLLPEYLRDDKDFRSIIEKYAPEWLITQSEEAQKKKDKLLEMAKSGEERPNQKTHPLGYNLSTYISKKSTCYDAEFTKKIKEVAPLWISKSEYKKQQIIEMAKNGLDRPASKKHPLATCLNNSLRSDAKFANLLRSLRPDWFK